MLKLCLQKWLHSRTLDSTNDDDFLLLCPSYSSQNVDLPNYSYPEFNLRNYFAIGIKELKINSSKSVVNVGSGIKIRCAVVGGPVNITITWSKEGKTIGQSHHTKVETRKRHSYLTIRNVKTEDNGEYYCQAR